MIKANLFMNSQKLFVFRKFLKTTHLQYKEDYKGETRAWILKL